MTDFVFITANDIHISDNGPRSRIDDFKKTMLNKIAQMRTACNKLNADAAIIAGDLYNLKNPARNSHRLNQELINEFRQFDCPVYMIEGNHDLTADRLESLKQQPLGVLFADRTLIQLRHEIIEKNGKRVSIVGVPYTENLDLTTLDIPKKEDFISQICVMHLYASLKPGFLYRERLYGYNELSQMSPDIFVLGHYHADQGIYEENNKYFINIGSMCRGVLSEDSLDHRPQIAYIKISVDDNKVSYQLQPIKLKIKPYHEIFDLEKRKEEIKEAKEIESFVEKLVSETVEKSKDKSIENLISKLDITQAVRDKVIHFIQEATVKK